MVSTSSNLVRHTPDLFVGEDKHLAILAAAKISGLGHTRVFVGDIIFVDGSIGPLLVRQGERVGAGEVGG